MTDAREGRGAGNDYGKLWQESKLWDNLDKNEHKCRPISIVFKDDGKYCKVCGDKL